MIPLSSLPSMASSPQAKRYDVFISFNGEDSRNSFASHFYYALRAKQISAFFDDHLTKRDEISSPILKAIEESTISVIIFSEHYAGSKLCLTELAKIMELKNSSGHIVIPVFYGVAPSDVRNQTGNFGVAFAKLEEILKVEEKMDLRKIRSNLTETADINGWDLQSLRSEWKLIRGIVGDILNKLCQMSMNYPVTLLGIESHICTIEALLCLNSPDLRVVGIYGTGGVGKTTIAKAVIHHISAKFDAFYFVEKVSKQSVDEIVSEILNGGESLNTSGPELIKNQLQYKKFLIVLDDIGDELKAKDLVGTLSDLLFGGSRILVTSRDKQVVENVVHDTYEVESLSRCDASQLFSLNAFKRNHPPMDRVAISKGVLGHAKGNPLALIVLGCALFGRSTEHEWLHVLDELGKESNNPLDRNVLRIGYDALNEDEKKMFLEIARYFIGMDLKAVVRCGNGVLPKLRKLVDKSLVIIQCNKIEMHDLLREMAYYIDHENGRRDCRGSPAVPPNVVLNYVFPLTNLVLEIVLVILDQIRSAQKPLYSLITLVVALSAMMVCLGELVYKGRHRNITLKWNGMRCKIMYPLLDRRPFFTRFDAFSLVCAISQLVFATVGYFYSRQHKENPIKVSLVSLSYIICMGASHIVNKSIDDDLSMKRNE